VPPSSIYARSDQALRVLLVGKGNPIDSGSAEPIAIDLPRTASRIRTWRARQFQHNPENAGDGRIGLKRTLHLMNLFRDELAEIHSLYALAPQQSRTTSDLVQAARAHLRRHFPIY